MNTRTSMTGWEKLFTGNCARNGDFIIFTKGICTNQDIFLKMKCKAFFDIQMDHSILARRLDPVLIDKKERTCYLADFAVPLDHRVEVNGGEKQEKIFGPR